MATESWAKMASNLDSHPKIRRGGHWAREVFLFALRRNAEPGNPVPGLVPAAVLEPWFIADQLMISESDAAHGLAKAIEVSLLEPSGAAFLICGWEDTWARLPKTSAERQADFRARKRVESLIGDDSGQLESNESNAVSVTRDDGVTKSNAKIGEERRGEEKEILSGKPDVAALAEAAVSEINRLAKTAYRADSKETLQHCKALSKLGVTSEQIRTTICARKGWLSDDKMAQYFRPSTLLRPSKVRACLEDLEARKPKRREQTPDDPPELDHLFGVK